MEKELWDAYDREGRLLGFDLVRGEPLPEGAWHMVVEIYALTAGGQVLVTRRHPEKSWGGFWEVTGGAVVKGEDPVGAALRELREETGISAAAADLHPVYVEARNRDGALPAIYHCFLALFDPERQPICLQEGETVAYRLLPYGEFKRFVLSDSYVPLIRRRFLDHQEEFDRLAAELLG